MDFLRCSSYKSRIGEGFMLLVIDVSNTNMVLGVFHGENLVANWRLSTKSGRTADETGLLICSLFAYSDVSVGDIEAIIVSSVVPDVMYSTLNGIKKILEKKTRLWCVPV